MKQKLYLLFLAVTLPLFANSQTVRLDPVDWTGGDSLIIHIDLNGTSLYGYTGDLFLWGWTKNGAYESFDSPFNGTWESSDVRSKLEPLGNNQYQFKMFPNAYFGVAKEFIEISGFEFLVKTASGDKSSADLGPYKPSPQNGIPIKNTWSADKKIRIIADLNGYLSGSGPFYYWAWYKKGATDHGTVNSGDWNNSHPNSLMTNISGTTLWYIDIIPTDFFPGAAKEDINPETLMGLVKTQNGSSQTPNFGKDMPYKNYRIYQTNASNVVLDPAIPTVDEPITITFYANGALKGDTTNIYFHSAASSSGLRSTSWDYSKGNWGEDDNLGKMTKITANVYQISIPSIRTYYNVPDSINVHKLVAVFRNAKGNKQEKDGTDDYQFAVQQQGGLEIREPEGKFETKLTGKPFRITGYNSDASDFEIYINNVLFHSENGTNRISRLYYPSAEGNYWIKIKSTSGSTVQTDSVLVNVCSLTSRQKALVQPAGLVYGINYSNDLTKTTLVLHAPTESIHNVQVIGDFNNWQANCDYIMNYDEVKKTFWLEIDNLIPGKEYVFQYVIDGKTRIGDPYTRKVSDPWNDQYIPESTYPELIPYPTSARAKAGETPTIASVLQTGQADFAWNETGFIRKPMEQLNIYQLHFRDFTEEGTFLAAVEKLDYLQRLGINAIATLPVSEFEGNDSWGYNPNFYFAIDKAYGTQDDFKYFVNECHKRGIAVLGDMVLNHAFGTNPMARMYWDDTKNKPAANNPWFNANHNFENPAAHWGYDFNHDSGHTKAFVDSVINYWLTEYKIDGIRFDFTKGFGNTPYPNPDCGDEWGGCYDLNRINLLKRMTDQMRLVKNGTPGVQPYVIMEHLAQGSEDKELADYGIGLWSGVDPNHKYSEIAMGYGTDPYKSNVKDAYYREKNFNHPVWISYMESHDEERLAYKAKTYGSGTIQSSDSIRSQFLQTAAVMNLLLRGPRQIWQFGELGYDYSIDYNSRTGRKPIRWDYFEDPHRQRIYDTYAKLFWLRNNMPGTFYKDIDNFGGTKTDFASQFKRYHYYSTVGDTAVTIVANTANSIVTGNPDFNSGAGTWYDFISGDTLNHTTSMTLQPGEFRVLMNKLPYKKPAFELTYALNDTLAYDSTAIKITFAEEILKVENILGRELLAADLEDIFELKDSLEIGIPFTGNIVGREISLIPNRSMEHGRKFIRLKPGTIQNFGGLKYRDTTFVFRIIAPPVGIEIDTNYTTCEGQTVINASYTQVKGGLNTFSILYSSSAQAAGFTDILNQSHDFTSGSLEIPVPASVEAGGYTGNLVFSNNSSLKDTSFILTITVNSKHKITLTSGVETNQQTICLGTTVTPITYSLSGGAETASVTGLVAGLSHNMIDDVLEISGTPSIAGSFPYTIISSGNSCKRDTLTGTINVGALASTAVAGSNQTVCPSQTIQLEANVPTNIESGIWSIFSGPAGSSTNIGSFIPKDSASNASFNPERGAGEYILVWTISNTNNCNPNSDTLRISVLDTLKPIFTTQPVTIEVATDMSECSATNVDLGTPPTVADNCTNNPTLVASLNGAVINSSTVFSLGENIVVWKATDASGNIDSVLQVVTVIDTTKPVFTSTPTNLSVSANSTGCTVTNVDLGTPPAVTDNCTTNLTLVASRNGAVINSSTVFNLGENIVVWKATDESGNKDSVMQVVTVTNPITLVVQPSGTGSGFFNLTQASVTAGSTLPAGVILTYHTDSLAINAVSNPSLVATSGKYFIKATLGNGCSVTKGINVTITPNANCLDHIVLTNPTDNISGIGSSVKANKTITASNKVLVGAKTDYQAGGSITLGPGTEIAKGAVFKAEIKGCDN